MIDNLAAMVIGIVSGIITAALIYLFAQTFQKIVVPWYEELIYKGIDISGEWHLEEQQLEFWAQKHIVNIAQKGHRITGSAVFAPDQGEDYEVRNWNVVGEVRDRFLRGYMTQVQRSRLGQIVFLMEVTSDGRRIEGLMVIYSIALNRIVSGSVTWERHKG